MFADQIIKYSWSHKLTKVLSMSIHALSTSTHHSHCITKENVSYC